MQMTSTFKHKKGDLVEQGFDLSKCQGDSIYIYSAKDGSFKPLTPEIVKDIIDRKIQF